MSQALIKGKQPAIDILMFISNIWSMNKLKVTPESNPRTINQWILWAECLTIFFVFPVFIYLFRHFMAYRVVPILVLLGPAAFLYLKKVSSFDSAVFTRVIGMSPYFRSMSVMFLIIVPIFIGVTWIWMPEHFFRFPNERPAIWLIVMLLYPILAALPQEILFRCFFFHRYKLLFSRPEVMIIVNGISFGLFHMFYNNWVAPVLSALGGCLFAWRYHRSQSLPVVAIEHALWGNILFTIGMGWYFYSGSIQ